MVKRSRSSKSSKSTFASSGNWSNSYKNRIRTQYSSPRSYAKFKTWIHGFNGSDLESLSEELETGNRWTSRRKYTLQTDLAYARRQSKIRTHTKSQREHYSKRARAREKELKRIERAEARELEDMWEFQEYKKNATKASRRSAMTKLASVKIPKEVRRDILTYLV